MLSITNAARLFPLLSTVLFSLAVNVENCSSVWVIVTTNYILFLKCSVACFFCVTHLRLKGVMNCFFIVYTALHFNSILYVSVISLIQFLY